MAALAIVKNLMGDDIQKLEAELNTLRADGAAACAEIDRLEAKKLEVDDFGEVEKIDRQLAKSKWKIARIDKRIPEVEGRLTLARDSARRELRAQLLEPISRLTKIYLQNAMSTRAAFAKLVAARAALHAAGFGLEANGVELGPHVGEAPLLALPLLEKLERSLEPPRVKVSPKPAPRQEPPKDTGRARPVSLDDGRHYRQKSRPVLREVPTEGEVMFMVHRGGLEFPAGRQLVEGDVVAMALADAIRLTKKCVGDIISAEALAELDTSDAMHSRLPAEGEK